MLNNGSNRLLSLSLCQLTLTEHLVSILVTAKILVHFTVLNIKLLLQYYIILCSQYCIIHHFRWGLFWLLKIVSHPSKQLGRVSVTNCGCSTGGTKAPIQGALSTMDMTATETVFSHSQAGRTKPKLRGHPGHPVLGNIVVTNTKLYQIKVKSCLSQRGI